jgi:hypothetical protein
MKIGIIGSDTSHCSAFAQLINNKSCDSKVTVVLPHFSRGVPLSMNRKEGIEKILFEDLGLERVPSVQQLIEKVDAVLLLAFDPVARISFFKELSAYQKPVFIDKPIALSATEANEVFSLSEISGTPIMSSSALRYDPVISVASKLEESKLKSVEINGPLVFEDHLPGYFWYGIHLIEIMYTLYRSSPDCIRIEQRKDAEILISQWSNGQKAAIRGDLNGNTSFSIKSSHSVFEFAIHGSIYSGLIHQILQFFKTGKSPIQKEETVGIISLIEKINAARLANPYIFITGS